jgi:uncharacterized protein
MTVGPVERDAATAEFFEATAVGQFLLRRCPDQHYSEPAAPQCTTCGRTDLEWVAASGGASLVSWAVTWTRAEPDSQPTPTILVIAELDEGPWWWSQLVGVSPDAVAVGQRIRVDFLRASAEYEAVPVFVPA